MVVRVADAKDAALASVAGVDAIQVMLPDLAHDVSAIRAIREVFPRTIRLVRGEAASAEDLLQDEDALVFDEIVVTSEAQPSRPSLRPVHRVGPAVLARVALSPDTVAISDAVRRAADFADGIAFEAGSSASFFEAVGIATLDICGSASRAAGLHFGFGGGLEPPDVARLLVLDPDWLAFDETVRLDHRADAPLSLEALAAVRALIPQEGATDPLSDPDDVVDRLFVRDFEVEMSIGAYRAERGRQQRVRFSIEAEVRRHVGAPRDMRDVFSYDVIIETIRLLSSRAHVVFVETLAEDAAAALLAYPAIESLRIKVEKLDVIDGSVGIEIARRRPARP